MNNNEHNSERLAAIEREIDQATARLWEAKLAYKRAKALVKSSRKERKKLRREHVRLQEELSGALAPRTPEGPDTGAVQSLKVADSPERTKAPHKKKVKLPKLAQEKELPTEGPGQ